MANKQCNMLDTKNKQGCRPRGMDISGVERFLIKKGGYAKPIGVALKKEYGKRISLKEYITKGSMNSGGKASFEFDSLGLARNLARINQEIMRDIAKHKKRIR